MALSCRNKVYDEIRKKWISATPEEIIRQTWLQRMICELGFPRELIAVEKELTTLPHLQCTPCPLPKRRVDLLCFAKDIHPQHALFPLILIECKDEPLSRDVMDQASAYNTFVQAFYVAVVNKDRVRCRYNLTRSQCTIDRLPSFSELMEALHE